MLDAAAREHWERHGWLWLRDVLAPHESAALARWSDEIAAWPETPGAWMRYYERPAGGDKQLARIENFLPFHEQLAAFFAAPRVRDLLAACCGEQVLLFKDKINFKLPGGAGFADHQDAPAYVDFGVERQLTLMVPVDAFSAANGCLEIARDACARVFLPHHPGGTLKPEVMANLDVVPLLARPGDLIVFDAFVPHRSGPNRSAEPRRAYYLTFNPASAGDHRGEYFARKRSCFPPEYERAPGIDYAARGRQFNLGNPFD
jgi:hypothetical protein